MAWYKDTEDLQDALVQLLKDNFNAKLIEVNNSKSTQLDIPTISSDAYFDSLDNVASYSSFILYGVEANAPTQNGNDIVNVTTFAFIAAYTGAGMSDFNRLMMRIQKAMTEIFLDATIRKIKNDITIINTDPLLIEDDNGNFTKAAGVLVQAAI